MGSSKTPKAKPKAGPDTVTARWALIGVTARDTSCSAPFLCDNSPMMEIRAELPVLLFINQAG